LAYHRGTAANRYAGVPVGSLEAVDCFLKFHGKFRAAVRFGDRGWQWIGGVFQKLKRIPLATNHSRLDLAGSNINPQRYLSLTPFNGVKKHGLVPRSS
jgi:hypothetical protein